MTLAIPHHSVAQLGEAVVRAVHEAFRDMSSSEPQLVANLVSVLPKKINQIALSGTTSVKAGGVFVHAQPFVACSSFPAPSPASVEIGDLLLLRTLVVNGQVSERRALLLQAKKGEAIPVVPDNQNQWHLYERWPKFTYAARSGSLKGKVRHIQEPDMYEAAKYLLIGTDASKYCLPPVGFIDPLFNLFHDWPQMCSHYTAQPTSPKLERYRCFTDELINFLLGNSGKIFRDPVTNEDGWNQVVHDLIEETARVKTIFMGRASGGASKAERGSGVLSFVAGVNSAFFMVAGDSGSEASGDIVNGVPDVPGKDFIFDGDDGGGMSIIEFVVEQGES